MKIAKSLHHFNTLQYASTTFRNMRGDKSIMFQLKMLTVLVALLSTSTALAVPIFARQTGQNCQACHAGGQFPELTPYGRMFKLTGYTLGQRTSLPIAAMAVFTGTSAPSNATPNVPGGAQQGGVGTMANGTPTFNTASLFAGGKLTDSVGMLAQYTFNNYAGDNQQTGHMGSDNTDFRYAQHIINPQTDLIFGFDANNNPGVQDVWNSSGVWGYNVVPGSTGVGGSALQPLLMSQSLGQQAVGASAYMYLDKTLYAELAGYRTGDGVFSFLTQNTGQIYFQGTNPYFRLALTHDWGTSNAMLGYTFFDVNQYENGSSGLVDEHRDNMVDFQYQYLLDPNVITFEMADANEQINYGSGGFTDSINAFRAKASYTYSAHYGASLSYFNVSNTDHNGAIFSNGGCADGTSGNNGQCGAQGWTPEVYFMPIQNVRIGLQYTFFNTVNGTTLNAKQNNTTLLYAWTAF